MTKEGQMTKPEKNRGMVFVISALLLIRHSSLGFRHLGRLCTAKVFSRRISGEDFAKRKVGEFTE